MAMAEHVARRSTHYTIIGGLLYRKDAGGVLISVFIRLQEGSYWMKSMQGSVVCMQHRGHW
jgi:hypothetical protein